MSCAFEKTESAALLGTQKIEGASETEGYNFGIFERRRRNSKRGFVVAMSSISKEQHMHEAFDAIMLVSTHRRSRSAY